MLGTELRPTEILIAGKDHSRQEENQCNNPSPGIIYHLSYILIRSSRPFSVGRPTSSLVPSCHFSSLVLKGKKSLCRIPEIKHYSIIWWKYLRTPLINLEDVFLTGLCANKKLGLELTHNKVWSETFIVSLPWHPVCNLSSNSYHEDHQMWLMEIFVSSKMRWQLIINTRRKWLTGCGVWQPGRNHRAKIYKQNMKKK